MNVIMAINMGGDDFVAKPFEMQVLLTKIQALLRRSYDFNAQQETGALEHGGILLNTTACTVDYEGKRAELSENENKIPAHPARACVGAGQPRCHDEPAVGNGSLR